MRFGFVDMRALLPITFQGLCVRCSTAARGTPIRRTSRIRLRGKTIPPDRCSGPLCCAKSIAGKERRLKRGGCHGMRKACFRNVTGVASSGSTKRPRGSETSGGPDAAQLTAQGNQNRMKCAIEWCPTVRAHLQLTVIAIAKSTATGVSRVKA